MGSENFFRAVKDLMEGKIAKAPLKEMFKQLERDEKIKSVGTVIKPRTKPIRPIPRSDFPIPAGIIQQAEKSLQKRKVRSSERLVLISPVLLSADRVWRFRTLSGEASYLIKDVPFLESLLSGRRNLRMKEGIELTATVETHEIYEGGIWVPKERDIVKVTRIHRKRERQGDLFAQPKKPKRRNKK